MKIYRPHDTVGGSSVAKPLTLTEALLVQILLQLIPVEAANEYTDDLLRKTGLTDEEVAQTK